MCACVGPHEQETLQQAQTPFVCCGSRRSPRDSNPCRCTGIPLYAHPGGDHRSRYGHASPFHDYYNYYDCYDCAPNNKYTYYNNRCFLILLYCR